MVVVSATTLDHWLWNQVTRCLGPSSVDVFSVSSSAVLASFRCRFGCLHRSWGSRNSNAAPIYSWHHSGPWYFCQFLGSVDLKSEGFTASSEILIALWCNQVIPCKAFFFVHLDRCDKLLGLRRRKILLKVAIIYPLNGLFAWILRTYRFCSRTWYKRLPPLLCFSSLG